MTIKGRTPGRILRTLKALLDACFETFLTSLPNSGPFPRWRLRHWRRKGCDFAENCYIARNVYFLGKVSMGAGSSVSNNCFINGAEVGITIGQKVMIAPNCVLVAFDHGYRDLSIPMLDQPWEESPIVIHDNVWIAANSTLTKGVTLGEGCIVGANSVVTKDVEPFSIVGGVPARKIGSRKPANDDRSP